MMTNVNHFKRNIADNPWCKLCGNLEETTLHVLRDCRAAKEVWKNVFDRVLTAICNTNVFSGDKNRMDNTLPLCLKIIALEELKRLLTPIERLPLRLFTFINVGFEGSAHDITVWNHCLIVPKFRFPHPPPGSAHDITVWNHCLTVPEFRFPHPPSGKYYLVDFGYPNTVGYLSPIKDKDIRTHMPEFRNGPPPQGILELFNYLHSSLRTMIERCFGQLKSRWKILTMMPNMDTKHQLAIMVATFTLHNFIRLHELDIPIGSGIEIEPRADYDLFNENRKAAMNEVQLNIAKEIWNFL
uniref:DDE Tnp4 domain-containing protein n=1 Tax=Chenopodium quinoa TaxID=63459 RepID=A0A803M192_CHEQI